VPPFPRHFPHARLTTFFFLQLSVIRSTAHSTTRGLIVKHRNLLRRHLRHISVAFPPIYLSDFARQLSSPSLILSSAFSHALCPCLLPALYSTSRPSYADRRGFLTSFPIHLPLILPVLNPNTITGISGAYNYRPKVLRAPASLFANLHRLLARPA